MCPAAFWIFPSSGVPIYRQLMDQLRSQMAGGTVRPGQMLPSVRTVAEQLQVNPMTVSKAYSLLEREGLVELVRGQGMRVREPAGGGPLKERLAAIAPLLEQVATEAFHLNLPADKVLAELTARLKEKRHA
ncbi:GntR family transcriptional regulator [Planctomycetia bacterium]|nr:GntR family transcriptional regulator [Planctomycetia bacterium]